MIKLDDFLTKKKEPAQVLDLSKVRIATKEEFKRYFDKIPECKVKPEKILTESIKIKDKEFSFAPGRREDRQFREWSYPDPTPPDMKGVKLEDLCPVSIDWKMLTTLRPKTKVEEDLFSRIVQLGKLDLKHQQSLKWEKSTDWIRKTKNPKSSIVEIKVLSCKECGEDFCDTSVCSKLMYESFFRPQATTSGPSQNLLLASEIGPSKKKKKKKKAKRKTRKCGDKKGRRKKLGKNSIFNRPASRGCSRDHSRKDREVAENTRARALSSTRSFSAERIRRSFYEGRSKSAPRIHFEGEILGSNSSRADFACDCCPSHTDYSSHSDSENRDLHRKFFSRLQLYGKKKLLSARVRFAGRNRRGNSAEDVRSKFVRKCTLYKGYHSDASILQSYNDDSSSKSSSPIRSRSVSKSPERHFPPQATAARYPSTIHIQFDEFFSSARVRFPENTFLPNKTCTCSVETKDIKAIIKSHKPVKAKKLNEGFPKVDLVFNHDSVKNCRFLP